MAAGAILVGLRSGGSRCRRRTAAPASESTDRRVSWSRRVEPLDAPSPEKGACASMWPRRGLITAAGPPGWRRPAGHGRGRVRHWGAPRGGTLPSRVRSLLPGCAVRRGSREPDGRWGRALAVGRLGAAYARHRPGLSRHHRGGGSGQFASPVFGDRGPVALGGGAPDARPPNRLIAGAHPPARARPRHGRIRPYMFSRFRATRRRAPLAGRRVAIR
ncbi:hypothetical protein J2X65_003344 [Ancylobacter sp. 3268]|nr:hypothetical protein [Ancylobacter sp. 3268]